MRCVFVTSEYTPKPAAATRISVIKSPTLNPSLFSFAAATRTEPLDFGVGAAANGAEGVGVAKATAPPEPTALLPPITALLCADPAPLAAAGVRTESPSR